MEQVYCLYFLKHALLKSIYLNLELQFCVKSSFSLLRILLGLSQVAAQHYYASRGCVQPVLPPFIAV